MNKFQELYESILVEVLYGRKVVEPLYSNPPELVITIKKD